MTKIALDQGKVKAIREQLIAIMDTGIELKGVGKTSIREVNEKLIAALKQIFQSYRALEQSDEELLRNDRLNVEDIKKFMEKHKEVLATHPKFNQLKSRLEKEHDVDEAELLRLASYIQNVYGDLLELIRLLEDEMKEDKNSSGAEIKLLKDSTKQLFLDTDHIDEIYGFAEKIKKDLELQSNKLILVKNKSKIVKDSQDVITHREKAIENLDKYIHIQLTAEAKKEAEKLKEEKVKEVYNKLVPIFTNKEYIAGLIARAKMDVATDPSKNIKVHVIELLGKDIDLETAKINVTAPATASSSAPPSSLATASPIGATGAGSTPAVPTIDPNAIKTEAKNKLVEKLGPHIKSLATVEDRDKTVQYMIEDIKAKFDELIKTKLALVAFRPRDIDKLAKKIKIRISNVRHIIVNEPTLANRNTLITSFNTDVVKHMQQYYIAYHKMGEEKTLKQIEKYIPDLKEISLAQGEAIAP